MTNQTGYIVYATDSVGTALGEIEPGAIRLLGEPGDGHVTAAGHIPFGQDIAPGEHVHLHNMRSDFDERASTLDAETALPEDVVYELY